LTALTGRIDNSATQAEVKYGIADHFHRLMQNIDRKDQTMNDKFNSLEEEARSLERPNCQIQGNRPSSNCNSTHVIQKCEVEGGTTY
jgi:hypothetical protein